MHENEARRPVHSTVCAATGVFLGFRQLVELWTRHTSDLRFRGGCSAELDLQRKGGRGAATSDIRRRLTKAELFLPILAKLKLV